MNNFYSQVFALSQPSQLTDVTLGYKLSLLTGWKTKSFSFIWLKAEIVFVPSTETIPSPGFRPKTKTYVLQIDPKIIFFYLI